MSYNDPEFWLIFAGIPLLVIAIVFALVYLSSASAKGAKRYRPGRDYTYAPVWFLARPETDGPAAASSAAPATGKALTAAEPAHPGVTGGASDRW